jgi:DNA-binding transcriptional regulator LsrR (DeoR family)
MNMTNAPSTDSGTSKLGSSGGISTQPERHALLEAGAVAETCALLFDCDGRPVKGLDDRRIGIPLSDLQDVPNVIAVGGGPDKANAIRSLLMSGVVNTAVIDLATARLMLDQRMV